MGAEEEREEAGKGKKNDTKNKWRKEFWGQIWRGFLT
jgi:hypothetical protein